ncbi:unnamed protein product [Hymenolepis diminuta]|uniref:Uncharacterized protein n=1 Tax=Hymenolepis diminuta TaxID=6216 RepID=A0A564Y4F7_HYMDI|nr:unnamed protein product [Hymenolepis diminuta]
MLPAYLLSSSTHSLPYLSLSYFKPVVVSLNTFWSNQLLVCSTIVVSSYSNSYESVTVIAVVIC